MILTFLLSKLGIRGIISAAIISILVACGGFYFIDSKHLAYELKKERETVGLMQVDAARLNGLLDAERSANKLQDAAVKQMQSETVTLETRVQQAAATIVTIKADHAAALDRIRTASIPTDCTGAVTWLGSEASSIVKSWNTK